MNYKTVVIFEFCLLSLSSEFKSINYFKLDNLRQSVLFFKLLYRTQKQDLSCLGLLLKIQKSQLLKLLENYYTNTYVQTPEER
jgi:hypothetical protein